MRPHDGVEMKDSGVPWIGQVPAHWKVDKLKKFMFKKRLFPKEWMGLQVLSLTLRGVVRNNIDDPNGLVPESYGTYQLFEEGDFCFKLIDLENFSTSRVGLVEETGIMSPAYIRMRARRNADTHFLYHMFKSWWMNGVFNELGGNGVRSALTATNLLDIACAVPPLPEQQAIASALDDLTAKVSSSIAVEQRRIVLLKELRTSMVHEAVTRGLNPGVEMKDSGVGWLGPVPPHWQVCRGREIFAERRTRRPAGVPQLTVSRQHGVIEQEEFIRREGRRVPLAVSGTDNFLHVRPNDFVIGLAAHEGGIEFSPGEGCVSPAYTVLRPRVRLSSDYYRHMLKASSFISALNSVARGIRQGKTIDHSDFGGLMIPVPPLPEQQAIAAHLDRETARILGEIERAERRIALLKELRTSLVHEAVTGRISPEQVREAAAGL